MLPNTYCRYAGVTVRRNGEYTSERLGAEMELVSAKDEFLSWQPRLAQRPINDRLCAVLRLALRCLGADGALFLQRSVEQACPKLIAQVGVVPPTVVAAAVNRLQARLKGPGRRESDHAATRWMSLRADRSGERLFAINIAGPASGCSTLAVHFSKESDVSEPEALERVNGLTNEISGLVGLYCGVEQAEKQVECLTMALDCSAMSVLVIDSSDTITYSNRAADELLDLGDCIRRAHAGFTSVDLATAIKLRTAITHVRSMACSGRGPVGRLPMLRLPRAYGTSIMCLLVPNSGGVVCYFVDSEVRLTNVIGHVCQLYRLSPVESRLAVSVVAGATVCEAAKALRIKEMTARAYLKQIFLKTGTRRQAELVRVLLSHAAPIRGDLEIATLA